MIPDILKDATARMDKALEVARDDFATIRTGRANPALFTKITADYYGAPTPLQQLASVTVTDAQTITIAPYDKSAIAAIESALRESDLGINPSNDGDVIRVNLPALTEERRKEFVKLAKAKGEDARVSVRNIRRKAREELERLSKDGEVSEDDVARAQNELDQVTKVHTDRVDSMLTSKEKELLEV